MQRPSGKYARRVQTMLTDRQYELLQEYAREIKKPLGVLLREIVEKTLIKDLERRRKEMALGRLLSGNTPVTDWPEMERQIEQRWEGCTND